MTTPSWLHSRASRRHCLRLGVAAAVAGAWPLRSLAAVTPDDNGLFDTLDLDWADTRRQRPVPVRLYLPQTPGAQPKVPLVVFSHGIGGSRRGYSWLGQHFARQGIASLHLQHTGSDRQLWTGSIFSIVGRLQSAAQDGEAIARVQDFRFALDTLLASELAARIDGSRVIAAGHSYGANTTLLASGARVEREGRVIELRDDRVQAAIVISAPPFYGESEPRKILQSVTVPSLHITATEDIIRIPGYYSGAEDRVAVFDATGSARKWLAVYAGGSHSMFTDRSGTGGATLNPQVKAATRALAVAFVQAALGGDAQHLAQWPQQHSAILARFSAVGT
jgi:predicted dienelactone hydrolase